MGPKYEFTSETKKWAGHTLHRIRRLSDGKIGGWIESEESLSQEGNCWVDDEAMVWWEAKVYGNAQIYDNVEICEHAQVYGNAKVIDNVVVYNNAKVYDDAVVYDNAHVFGTAKVYGNAKIYGNAEVWGNAKVYGNTKVYGDIEITDGEYTTGEFSYDKNASKKVIQDFIYKVDDSNKLTTQTEYDSIDEFFSEPITNDIKLDTLIICSIDTKEPLIKLQKVETDSRTEFKFIVEITNEDSDDFIFRSIIKSQDQLNQLIQKTIEALRLYPKFNKYADDLEEYL